MHVNLWGISHSELVKFQCIQCGIKSVFEIFYVAVESYSSVAAMSDDKMNLHLQKRMCLTKADLKGHAFAYYKNWKWLQELNIHFACASEWIAAAFGHVRKVIAGSFSSSALAMALVIRACRALCPDMSKYLNCVNTLF